MVYRKIEANGQKLDYSIENISPRSNDGRISLLLGQIILARLRI